MVGPECVHGDRWRERPLDLLVHVTVEQAEGAGEVVAGAEGHDPQDGVGARDPVHCEVHDPVPTDRHEERRSVLDGSSGCQAGTGRRRGLEDRRLDVAAGERRSHVGEPRRPARVVGLPSRTPTPSSHGRSEAPDDRPSVE